jgi:S1-C subfamily serine protease
MNFRLSAATIRLVAVLSFAASPVAAQQTVSAPATRPNNLGFSYGWSGGIAVERDGRVTMRTHPRVSTVRRRTGAAAAGLQAGDVIVSVDGRDARDPAALRDIRPGHSVTLLVRRGRRERRIVVRVAREPA